MPTTRHFFTLALISISPFLIPDLASADIGSKHQDLHKSDDKPKRDKPSNNNQPFDFSEVAETLLQLHSASIEEHIVQHVDQEYLEALPGFDAYVTAFEEGDALFEINFNALDGVGVNVGNGQRFTSIPRLDLDSPEAWANVFPNRITGPNGDSCISCHDLPVADGAGGVNDNVIRIDPERKQKGFIERQAPHVFGMGAVQLLAEEMTEELHAIRDDAINRSMETGQAAEAELVAKNIHFGTLRIRNGEIDVSQVTGVDRDLVVKPFEWKGLTAFVRDFVRGASHQELGMQATELVGDSDSDFDGISNELSVGDITALAIYNAARPRPVTRLELNQISNFLQQDELDRYGLPLDDASIASIQNGALVFEDMRCSQCHTPAMAIEYPTFSEPSRHEDFRDIDFPAGEEVPLPSIAIQFDLTREILDNPIPLASGQTLGQFERIAGQAAIVRLYGDLKRHDMGKDLAEAIDEGNLGASVFLTENLWGVGSTAPYLHDGRATTLGEAILYHGGDATTSKEFFESASTTDQKDLIAFLNNLVLYLAP
ncbi:di-heme oxidoredictase family protein [Pseudomonadota bacterium]